MPVTYMPPLPQQKAFGIEGFDWDKFKLWIQGEQWSFKKAITIQGDIVSANWDGAEPLDLSSVDTTATAGFALDASEGAAQFEGEMFLGGNLTLEGGEIRTSSSGERVQIQDVPPRVLLGTTGGDQTTVAVGSVSTVDVDMTVATTETLFLIGRNAESTEARVSVADVAGEYMTVQEEDAFNTVTDLFTVKKDAALFRDGSASAPGLAFLSDTNTGIYRGGENQLDIATGGSTRVRIGSSFLIVSAGSLDDDDPRLQPAGSASNPAYSFRGDLNTGMYRISADIIGIATGGAERLRIQSDYLRTTGGSTGNPAIKVTSDSNSTPGYTWSGDSDTGMYRISANYLGLAAAGTLIIQVASNDTSLPGVGTTTNSSLPAYRSGEPTTTSIERLTSSRRFKKFIKRSDFDDLEPIFDAIEVKNWKEKKTMIAHPSEKTIHGVIAEEVFEYAPQYVVIDDDGLPSAVDPANAFIMPTIAKVKRLEKRIAELERFVAA